jgi:thiol-disulfide isomerase/thioredoxin
MRPRIVARPAALLALAALLASPTLVAGPRRGLALAPGDPAPSIEGRMLNGDVFHWKWSDHALTVLNFWSTTCEPCKVEMPELQKLSDRRKKDGLAVVGVLMDVVPAAEALDMGVKEGIRYTLVRGNNAIEAQWEGVLVLPVTYLVSRQGTIVRRYVGAAPEIVQSLVRDAEAVLDGRPLGPIEMPATPPS